MAGVVTKGTEYANGSQITSSNLNALVDDAVFSSNAVDDGSTALNDSAIPAIIVKNAGISAVKLATDAVETAKIKDGNVTKAKIENVANLKVLGNVSGGAAAPAEVAILDEDTMSSNSATSLATQQSIKEFVLSRSNTAISTLATAHEVAISGRTYVDVSTLTTAITAKKTSSTFIASGMLNVGHKTTSSDYIFKIQFKVGSGAYQDFNLPTGGGSRTLGHFSAHIKADSDDELESVPFTVPLVGASYSVNDVLTFKIQVTDAKADDDIYINRSEGDTDSTGFRRTISTLKVEEI